MKAVGQQVVSITLSSFNNIPKHLAMGFISVYRRVISPLTPPSCRFVPTCSEYASSAIERYGVAKGGLMAIKRIGRCHPWHPGGYDPVK